MITGSVIASPTDTRQGALGRLAHWCQPRIRPRLVYAVDPGEAPMALGLRGSQLTAPYTNPQASAFSVSWVAPNPVAYALQPHSLTLSPQGNFAGRTYTRSYPRIYPISGGSAGLGTCTNGGDYPTWPRFLIYGPCSNPAVWWVTPPGGAVVFANLTVAAGDYVDVDTSAQTVLLNSLPGSSRDDTLDFGQTVWQPFYAGDTTIRSPPKPSRRPASST